jgi:carboxymethylenebutenolidase
VAGPLVARRTVRSRIDTARGLRNCPYCGTILIFFGYASGMCHDPEAVPAIHRKPRTAIYRAEPHTLTSADGTTLAAYSAHPAETLGGPVLVLPDNRGLAGFYEALCDRLAEQGHPATAIDYYARTAGPDHRARDGDFPFMQHLFKTARDTLYADIEAGLEHLRAHNPRARADVRTVGFCFGGRLAFCTASSRFGLAGAVGFYGYPDELFGAPGPTQLAGDFTAPVLGLFGGADDGIPPSAIEAFDDALSSAEVPHDLVTFPGMPHGFFETGPDGDAATCAEAWHRVLEFLRDTPGVVL